MTYREIVDWLFAQIPNYQHQGGSAYKPGLDRTLDLLQVIGNPHHQLKTIHVAGTNGKGSVSHIMAAVFANHGYKTGLFTSPHINDFRERIKINGNLIDEDFVVRFVEKYRADFERIQPSFFEITTAMAFAAFAEKECDIAVIETGLGGRLDSTNVISPEMAIITNIGLDHIAFLGNTLEAIASEKAGIIKENTPVVIGDMAPALYPIFQSKANEMGAELVFSQNEPIQRFETDLMGEFQQRNLQTAKTALNGLKSRWKLDEDKINAAFLHVASAMQFRGRLQKIGSDPLILVDAAHNTEGINSLLNEISFLQFDHLHLIYGASNDKDWKEILELFPHDASLYLTEFDSKRSVTQTEFQNFAENRMQNASTFKTIDDSLKACKTASNKNDLIVICGSFYLIEKII